MSTAPYPVTERSITGYHRDEAGDWVAELDCHHNQHVRHKPPFTNRPWVTSQRSREAHIGAKLNCALCDRREIPASLHAYKRTPEFTESTIPQGLQAAHATKKGVWGQIHVLDGRLQYTIESPDPEKLELAKGDHANISPEVLHSVAAIGSVRFYVEFYSLQGSNL
ncbi:MAG: DUF3565 domain-containing protein [Gammaproteobacteria bacterium]